MLGGPAQAPSGPYAGDPGAGAWSAPPAAASGTTGNHHVRNGLLAGAAALAVLAAGVGIGHAAWTNGSNTQALSPTSNTTHAPSGSGNGNGSGNGSPFGGGSGGFGGFGNSGNSGNSGSSGNTGSGNSGSSNSSGPSDVNAIADKVDPGLVDINTTLGYQQEQAAGTGIVLSSNGVILTNNHVIDGATSISVTDVGNQKTYTASVVGYDRTKDIAVLQLHNASGLQTATLGNSSNASVGEQIVGVGNAGGTGGTPSAAGGTVTALNQSITASDEGDGTSEQLSGLIQTNANIQPGDSGGALVDTSGQVLGVDTAASAGFSFQSNDQSQGTQGFAIPINTALSIARAIEAGAGSSTVHIGETAFLGVEISPVGHQRLRQQRRARWVLRGQQRQHRAVRVGRLGRRRRHQRPGPRGRPRPGRRDHLTRWHDDQLVQRPHQRHGRVPPRRQGDGRLDGQLGTDPHGDGPALVGPAAVAVPPTKTPTRRRGGCRDRSRPGGLRVVLCRYRAASRTSETTIARTAALSTVMRPHPTLTLALAEVVTCEIFCTMRNMS